MDDFVNLHVHSEYSLLDGACKIRNLIQKVKKIGQTAVAITDHGVMYGAMDFYKEAKSHGIKPIIGCEVYVAARGRFDKTKEFDAENRHLILLCENMQGYQNLIEMVSRGFIDGFYKKPRIDEELLQKYHGGLIALSACLAGEIPRMILKGNYEEAKEKAVCYREIFGKNNYYLELQDHGMSEQKYVNPFLVKIAEETGIPLIATNDCHYIDKEDSKMHEVLLCIQTGHTIKDANKMEFATDQFYLKSADEMKALFPQLKYPDAIKNTVLVAEKCNLEFSFGDTKLPHFDIPDNQDNFEYFKNCCYSGLNKYYGENPESHLIERLEYELNIINNMGYVDYFLIVHDFIKHARSMGIPVGPGRGSGAGSLAAYCIGITGLDPIKYNLIFERFLNPERVSMPDFDIDFCYIRRQEVIDYVIRKYGADHVAQIITFGTMAARGAIRDAGRAMAISYQIVDKIAKLIPMELGITISKSLRSSKDLKNLYNTDKQMHELIDMALKIEGMPRHASTHAAGVVITKDPVRSYVPLAKNDEAVVTQYTMTTLEQLGLLKMDFLGLRTLTVIDDAEKLIRRSFKDFDINDIDEQDKGVFEIFSSGCTEGVFQFESLGMTNVLTQLKPSCLEDIIAVISLYRPGPMSAIPKYIENRHNIEKITYKHEKLQDILKVTYGCIVYQEQVMQIFRTLAGYSLGRADIVRRAMSKKNVAVMEKERKIFIYGLTDSCGNLEVEGCIRRGVKEEIAIEIFNEMESFALYAFNKSHAAAYALISYQTAWLKYKYPREYMAALLTSVLDSTNKIARYIAECTRLKICVLPPSINESEAGFTTSNGGIRFALLAIKNLGKNLIESIIDERKNSGKFSSFYNFCKRMHEKDLNKRALESLIRCGALDSLGQNRRQMLIMMEKVLNSLNDLKKKNLEGQIGFFDLNNKEQNDEKIFAPNVDEFPIADLLSMEKSTTGMYLSGHPLAEYSVEIEKNGFTKIGDILSIDKFSDSYKDGDYVNVFSIVTSVQIKTTKNSATMAFVMLEDMYGSIEMLVFPKILEKFSSLLMEDHILKISAKLSIREDEEPKLICEKISPVDGNINEHAQTKSKKPGLYIKISSKEFPECEKVNLLLSIFSGKVPVYIFVQDTEKLLLAPQKMWIDLNEVLIKELKIQLGDKNVVVKQ
ncbi:MAG: DNA polymerase III subunit alpha [Oscillospiraceae bacterium]|jgi:DNA polymerase-3 subunit alpha|nr:DNA polymerase III subunit alpha [Oscillospiraceae bacterium]